MSHRYATRSTTPTHLLEVQGLTRTRVKNSRRNTSIPVTSSSVPNEQTVHEAVEVEVRDDSVQNNRQIDTGEKASPLPCLNHSFDGQPEIITCAICFNAMSPSTEPMATRCGHIFCAKCLSKSLQKRNFCPTCQAVTKFSKCIRLYF